jgi:hypothetical protein
MKVCFDFFPEICLGVIALMCSGLAHLAGVDAEYIGAPLLLMFMFLIWRVARGSKAGSRQNPKKRSQLEDPRDFRKQLLQFCDKNLAGFRLVPERLVIAGPMITPADTTLSGPRDIEMYLETLDTLNEVGIELMDFFVTILGCEIRNKRSTNRGKESVWTFEARKSAASGFYVVMISPAMVDRHYRIQIGRQLALAA